MTRFYKLIKLLLNPTISKKKINTKYDFQSNFLINLIYRTLNINRAFQISRRKHPFYIIVII
jgi:hypothetical protein